MSFNGRRRHETRGLKTGVRPLRLVRLLTDFDGRIGLRAFWLGSAIVALALLTVQQLAPRLADRHAADQIIAFTGAFALFPWAALSAKRATDRGSSALFGILLVCAIVLPGQLKSYLSIIWTPSLDTVSLLAWCVALVDLGLMPSAHDEARLAEPVADAKAGAWTPPHPSPSIRSTPSP